MRLPREVVERERVIARGLRGVARLERQLRTVDDLANEAAAHQAARMRWMLVRARAELRCARMRAVYSRLDAGRARAHATSTATPVWPGARLTTQALGLRLEWDPLPVPSGETPFYLAHAAMVDERERDLRELDREIRAERHAEQMQLQAVAHVA